MDPMCGSGTIAIEAALRAGAALEAKDGDYGRTALLHAAFHGHAAAVEALVRAAAASALLKAGADRAVKATGGNFKGMTTLEIATKQGHEAVAALLR